ncbi:DUF1588 domain-containing protein [Verrucomicrobiota bacterium sgz303538]
MPSCPLPAPAWGEFAGGYLARCWRLVLLAGVMIAPSSRGNELTIEAKAPQATAAPTDAATALVEKYCFDCHAEGMHKGKFSLDDIMGADKAEAHRPQWEKVWKIVRHEFMPPVDADRPSDAERKAITQWIEQKVLGVDYSKPDPGLVTIRRMNRMEYEYSVTDLFGVNLSKDQEASSDGAAVNMKLRDQLPPDDTAFGFDNIGDFQTLSPALLEKFFSIAEFVVDHVIVQDGPRYPELNLGRSGWKAVRSDKTKRTDHSVEFELKHAGRYQLQVQFMLGGWQDYGGAYDFDLKLDDHQFAKEEIEIGGQKTYKYRNEVVLEPGRHVVSISTDAKKPDSRGALNHLELRPKITLTGPVDAGIYEYPESHTKIFFRGAAPANPQERRTYAKEIVQRVADRAFRQPTDDGTLERLTEIVMRNENFERGVGQALTAILTSPRFLFRAELQPKPDDPKEIHLIDEFALASRLSYLLWLSIPDEELSQLAAKGELRKNLRQQVKRMVDDPKSGRFFEDFPGQWLRTRNVLMTAISRRDAELNPVRGSMKRETELLFEHIARNDKDLIELLTADYTFVDRPLAEYYGLKEYDYEREGFQKVHLSPESKRGGILTHGSFLVSTSNPNRTSPVKRGLFVLENLLATEPPPPPPDIPPLDDAKAGAGRRMTVREQLEVHRENKSCAACHAHFDPIGLVLENYDIVGRWRDKEFGEPIDPRTKTITGEELSSIDDLRKLFAARKDKFYRGVTEKLLTYALGRGLDPHDAVTVDRITDQMVANNGSFSTLLMGVIESPAFQMRRGDSGELKTGKRPVPETPKRQRRRPESRPKPDDGPRVEGRRNFSNEASQQPPTQNVQLN